MRAEVVQQLLNLNQDFYERLADPFAQSRMQPQPGFYRLLEAIPRPCRDLLDVGCGDGRFGRFLLTHEVIDWYTGVDFSADLLTKAASTTPGDFYQREISRPGCLDDLGQFDAISCLAVLQHIPARVNRLQLLREMKACLTPGGRILLSTWQFMDSQRLQRKVQDWGEVGLSREDVEWNDYLMTWERGGFALRYVSLIDSDEMSRLAEEAELRITNQFRSDGKEGNLSLYNVLSST